MALFAEIAGSNAGIDVEEGRHQVIDHYEVAIGTDRTSHKGRTNVRPFTNVGKNTSWVYHNLNLESESETSFYYCTVKAYSASTASTEVTSNGIRVGQAGVLIKHGSVEVSR